MFRDKLVCVALAIGSVTAAPAVADNRRGLELWNRGDAFEAVNEFRAAAIAGEPEAQYNLARAYQLGRGVPLDLKMAESWYGRAAAQGHAPSRNNYGLVLFQNGDRSAAMPYIEEAAGRGDPRAQYVLGTALFNGDGVKQDWVRSYALMTRASAAGIPQASASLAQMDKYIPAEQRQRGLTLARTFGTDTSRTQLAGNLVSDAPPSRIVREDMPPSQVGERVMPVEVAPKPRPVKATPPKPTPPRPTPVAVAATNTPHWASANDSPPPMPAAAATGGRWKVQLAAFGDASKANALWSTLHGRIAALGPYRAVIVRAGPITRLQAGPLASSAAAGKLCAAVRASGQTCIPVAP